MICEFVNWVLNKYANYIITGEYKYCMYDDEVSLSLVFIAVVTFVTLTIFGLPLRLMSDKLFKKMIFRCKNCRDKF